MWKFIIGIVLVFQFSMLMADGELDTSFGIEGKVVTEGTETGANSVAIQNDGKIVVCGRGWNSNDNVNQFSTLRYNANGELDDTFGTDGEATTNIGVHDNANSLLIQENGKIIVAGSSDFTFSLLRYNLDGSLDSTFGTNGTVTTPQIGGNLAEAKSIILQTDGKIVAAGYRGDSNNHYDFAVVRYNVDATLDSNFEEDGVVITDLNVSNDYNAYATDLAIQKDGKIVVIGYADDYENSRMVIAVVRYLSDGRVDASFGHNGKAIIPLGGFTTLVHSVAIQEDGKIVVGGFNDDYDGFSFILIRYNADGSLDNDFGSSGIVKTPNQIPEGFRSIVLQENGKIVAGGMGSDDGANLDFTLMRYDTHGNLDMTFGTNGKVATAFTDSTSGVNDIALQNDGKIVAAGIVNDSNHIRNYGLTRYKNTQPAESIILSPIYYLLQ